jgi:conjugal transfer ATP-binding protein TraC
MMSRALADRLEIWGVEDDFLIFSDGSFGFGLRATPLDVSAWDDDGVSSLATRAAHFLNGLPEGVDLQFVQDIAPGNADVLRRHGELCRPEADEVAKALCTTRLARLTQLDQSGQLPTHSLRIFVRRGPVSGGTPKRRRLVTRRLFQQMTDERVANGLKEIRHLRDNFVRALDLLPVRADMLSANDVLDLVYQQWNPTRAVQRPAYSPDDVRSSLVFSDAAVDGRGFSLGDKHHRLLSLKTLPEVSYSAMAAKLRALPFDSRLFLTIRVPNQQKEIETLQTQRRLAFALVHGKRTGVRDLESEAKFQDLESLLENMISQGERVFHVGTNVLLRAQSPEDLDQQVAQALMTFRELGGAEAMEESLAAFDIFSTLAIPNARCRERQKRLKTSNLADLLPLFGPWAGHQSPSILLRSRAGSLVSFDPFSAELTNANQIVSGGSGSGKSFLTNVLLLHTLKECPKIFIIDIGGSYRKLCETLSGQYLPLSVGINAAINPFDLLPGQETADSQKVKFLLGMVELMTKDDAVSRLPKLERAEVERCIEGVFKGKSPPRLSTLREALLNHSDPQVARLGRVLAPWCGGSAYGQLVDRPTTVQLESPIVCFDLKGMESHPDLQAVFLFLITDLIWRNVQMDKVSKKFVVFDECWKLLEDEAGASFIGEVFRTFRKYHASAVAISQNIDDFARSRIAAAVLPNASIKWILRQKGADQERLKSVLSLNPNEAAQIDSLHQERGHYSEAFLMAQDQRAVVVIESAPLEYWIATTDPREMAMIDEHTKVDGAASRLETLSELARRHPHGLRGA